MRLQLKFEQCPDTQVNAFQNFLWLLEALGFKVSVSENISGSDSVLLLSSRNAFSSLSVLLSTIRKLCQGLRVMNCVDFNP